MDHQGRPGPVGTSTPGALVLNGTVGVGKTSVAEAVGEVLTEARVPNAVIDMDSLRRAWPPPPHDRFNTSLALRNLASVAANYLDSGATVLVVAAVVETRTDRDDHQAAIGTPLVLCRLRADLAVVRDRLTRRHAGQEAALQWHLDRSRELDVILDSASVDDHTVDVTRATLAQAATKVLRAVGWTVST